VKWYVVERTLVQGQPLAVGLEIIFMMPMFCHNHLAAKRHRIFSIGESMRLSCRRRGGFMIEKMEGLPDGVLGFTAKGTVTGLDYEQVIVPAVEETLAKFHKVRFLYSLGNDFKEFEAAAMWEDAKIGLKHLTSWERIALVTDVDWIRAAMKAFGFLLHGHVRAFRNSKIVEARTWISEEL